MSKWRVAHLIYSRKIGGSEMVAASICANLDRNRFQPLVLFMNKLDGDMPKILKELGVPCYGFDITRISRFFRLFIIARLLRKLQVDILHIHHIPLFLQSVVGARFSGLKGLVVTEHAKYSISRSLSLQNGCRRAAEEAGSLTTVSDDLKKYFVDDLGISETHINVIKNGVDTTVFSPLDLSPGNTCSVEKPVYLQDSLISVGRLVEAKDQATLLRAMRLLKDKGVNAKLSIIGEGHLQTSLETLRDSLLLGDHVSFLGNRTDVHRLLPEKKIFILSSQREGLPMALLEAMASGLAVVATPVGGIGEVVEDGVNGFLVPPGNPERLAGAIELLVNNTEKCALMGKKNRELILNQYSMAVTAKKYENLYAKILAV